MVRACISHAIASWARRAIETCESGAIRRKFKKKRSAMAGFTCSFPPTAIEEVGRPAADPLP